MTDKLNRAIDVKRCEVSTSKPVVGIVLANVFALLFLTLYGGDRWRSADWTAPEVHQPQLQLEQRPSWRQLIQTTGENRTKTARLIFYNRVDKCGSSTLNSHLTRLGQKNRKFKTMSSTVYFERFLNQSSQLRLVKMLTRQSRKQPLLYDRHVYFINFTEFKEEQPIYINLLRDPVERFISFYHFLRLNRRYKDKERKIVDNEWMNKSLSECVLGGDPECAMTRDYHHRGPNGEEVFHPMTAFFCGQEPMCKEFNNKSALQRALHHLEKKYAVVGILEAFERSLQVLQSYVPMYFREAVTLFDKKPLERNKNDERPEAPPIVKQTLASRLWADIELYRFAEQRLYLQYRRMGGSVTPTAARGGAHQG